MRGLVLVGAAIVATLATAGAAAAGNPGKPAPPGQAQTPPGQEQTPPGQAKRAEAQPDKAIPPGQQNAPAGQDAQTAAETEGGNAAPPAPAPARRADRGQQGAASPQPETPAATAPVAAAGNSPVARTHAIVCHRTGSLSHPYVVINISRSAWLEGHTTHPALNGHDDVLLEQGAAPGEKLLPSACPVPLSNTPTTPRPTGDPKKPTPPASTPDPGRPDPGRPGPRPSQPPLFPEAPVLGDVAPAKTESSGVAARVAVVGAARELPFTGMPLWVAVLAGFWLIGSGLAIRKAFYDPASAPANRPGDSSRG